MPRLIRITFLTLVFGMAFYAISIASDNLPGIDYARTPYAKAAGILTSCRIIDKADATEPDKVMTRQEAAVLFGKTLTEWRFKPEEYVSTQDFSDWPADAAVRGYIAYCVDHGIISPKSAKVFAPKDQVTLDDYCSMLTAFLELPDADTQATIARLGLLDGLDTDGKQPLTRSTAYIMLQRALFSPSLTDDTGKTITPAAKNFYAPQPPGLFDVVYVPGSDNPKQRLDIYYPNGEAPANGWPVLIVAHGGGFSRGDKFGHRGSVPLMEGLQEGFAIVAISYRLVPEAIAPAQILDAKAAVRFLKVHAAELQLDPRKFVFAGLSAGGNLAAVIATSADNPWFEDKLDAMGALKASDRVAAVIGLYGSYDYRNGYQQLLWLAGADNEEYDTKYAAFADVRKAFAAKQNLADYNPYDPEWKYELLGGKSVTEAPELLAAITAVTYAKTDIPPFLLLHGDHDATVAFLQAVDLFDALQNEGAPVELVIVPNADHGRDFTNVYDITKMFKWLEKILEKK